MSATVNPFVEVEPTGPQPNGTPGGDSQVGESWSRRFQRQLMDRTWNVVSVDFYVLNTEQDDDKPEHLVLVRNVESVICPDPNEPDRDATYEHTGDEDVPFAGTPTDRDARNACMALTVEHVEIEFGNPQIALRAIGKAVRAGETERDRLKAEHRTALAKLRRDKNMRNELSALALAHGQEPAIVAAWTGVDPRTVGKLEVNQRKTTSRKARS